MRYTIEATIPVVQYGNIKPSIQVESPAEEAEALAVIRRLWDAYGEQPIKDKTGGGVRVDTFTGEVVFYDDINHIYTDEKGNKLLSGSKYAEKYSPKFEKDKILPKTANAWGVTERELDEIWTLNGDISTCFGNAIHKALELAHKHWATGEAIQSKKEFEKNYVLPKNEFIADAVTKFVEQFGVNAKSEVMVSDVSNGMVGTIDRLEMVAGKDSMKVRVGDFKTNNELSKKDLDKYQKQLSFYAHILINKGWEVEGLDIFHWDGTTWNKIELPIVPLEA